MSISDTDISDYDISEILGFLICNYWSKREAQINTDYDVTGWMLCVIPHIYNGVINKSYGNIRKQVNNRTKKLFDGLLDDEVHPSLYIWTPLHPSAVVFRTKSRG